MHTHMKPLHPSSNKQQRRIELEAEIPEETKKVANMVFSLLYILAVRPGGYVELVGWESGKRCWLYTDEIKS